MKQLFSLLFLIALSVILAVPAFADRVGTMYPTTVFAKYTGAASTARYSGVLRVERSTKKTVFFQGYSTNGTDTLANLPGTAVLQCGATASGPWLTSKDIGASTATSATTSTIFTVDDLCQYLRVGWTKTGTGKRSLSAWILYGE